MSAWQIRIPFRDRDEPLLGPALHQLPKREIRSVDVFEVSVTPRRANDGTRVIGLKSISPTDEELRRRTQELGVLPTKAIDSRPIKVASFEC